MHSDHLFDLIEAIGMVSSKKAKKNMMIPELKQILNYTYDPFKTYGVLKSKWTGRIDGAIFNEHVWRILDHLATRKITGGKAKTYVDSFCYNLTPKSCRLFKRILKKDLRCGISIKSINEVFPGLVADGITMQPTEYESRLVKFPTMVSVKLRGCRGYYSHKDNLLYSRRGKPYRGLSHITNALRPLNRDFDGELIVPGIPFETGVGLIRSHKETSKVKYCIFDAPDEFIFKTRYNIYISACHMLSRFIVPITHVFIDNEPDLLTMLDDALYVGYEGLVTKDPNSDYEPGYQTTTLKLKEIAEPIDLEVISVYEGTGKYAGMLGGVVVEYKGVEVRVGSGFSDGERALYYNYPNKIVGKTITVKYQEKTKDGSLRNPVKLEVRHDK